MEDLRIEFKNGKMEVFPVHEPVKNFVFHEDEQDEARLAEYVSRVAKKNGMTKNDIFHVFPFILRMLKSKIEWAG